MASQNIPRAVIFTLIFTDIFILGNKAVLYCFTKVVLYTETNGQGRDLRQRKTQQLGTENMTGLLFKK